MATTNVSRSTAAATMAAIIVVGGCGTGINFARGFYFLCLKID